MRILVLSDSHGSDSNLRRVLLSQPKAEVVIHLGDGEAEVARAKNSFPEKTFLQVRGNCDWGSTLPDVGEYIADGKKIFFTHGHLYAVKQGLTTLVYAARERKADIALFGHTHKALTDYEDGLYIMNPGVLKDWPASYGIIDITPQGIVTNVINLP